MVALKFVLAVTCVVAVSAYGRPPKKTAVLPPNPDKYDTVGSLLDKGDDYKKGELKAQEDVLYVKGQPIESVKEEVLETGADYGGKYGGGEKIKEVKVEESKIDLGGGYGDKPLGGHGKKVYGSEITKEVKEVKYDSGDKFGPEEGKFEETKFGGGGYGGGGAVVKEIVKEEKKFGGAGYGGHGKKIIKEEVIKETYEKGPEGGYLPESPKGGYRPVVPSPKESYGGWGEDKKGGFGGGEKIEETIKEVKQVGGGYGGKGYGGEEKIVKEVAFEGKSAKGGYGFGGKGGFGEEKIEETIKEGGYGGSKFGEEKIVKEEVAFKGKGYGIGGPKGGFGEEKIEETISEGGYGKGFGGPKYGEEKIVKEEVAYKSKGGYGAPKGGFVEEKIEETIKEGGAGYGGEKPFQGPKGGFGYEKEIKTTKFGGGGFGEEKLAVGGGYGGGEIGGFGPKPITTLSTQSCNKMIDGLLGKLQHSFTSHFETYKVDRVSPVQIGGWARVRLYDGKFDKIGQICRGGDFQVLPQGENIIVRGTITVPQPRAKFCGDAYLYNRLKVRNRNLILCAKDASFRMQMIINKKLGKIDVDQLEPVGIHGFEIEDDKGLRADALAWPFNKIREHQLSKQKYQFMSTLQHKLCDDFREIVARPDITKEIVRLV